MLKLKEFAIINKIIQCFHDLYNSDIYYFRISSNLRTGLKKLSKRLHLLQY